MRLEQVEDIESVIESPYFNSIKVRLERVATPDSMQYFFKFQFHKGAIRTGFSYIYKTKNVISIP